MTKSVLKRKSERKRKPKINFNLQKYIAFINKLTVLKFLCDCFYAFFQVALQAQKPVHFISF